MSFDEVIADLERIHVELGQADDFIRSQEGRYLEVARKVSAQTLMLLRPDDQDAAEWKERVEDFCDLITSKSLAGGLEILYAGRLGSADEKSGPGTVTPITYDDVLAWVQAGADNGGKDITAVEASRGRRSEQIAYDVFTAIRQHRLGIEKKDYGRITERLETWVNSRVLAGDMDGMLTAVLEAWEAALFPLISADFEQWVDEVIR